MSTLVNVLCPLITPVLESVLSVPFNFFNAIGLGPIADVFEGIFVLLSTLLGCPSN